MKIARSTLGRDRAGTEACSAPGAAAPVLPDHPPVLATVHWVAAHDGARTVDEVVGAVYQWNDRKRAFEPRQIQLVATGHAGDHFHRITGDPGTHPAEALRQGLAVQSRGANGASRSEPALDGTCEPWHSRVEHRPERVRSRRGSRTRVCDVERRWAQAKNRPHATGWVPGHR
jgi:hypothetical protein